MPDATTKVMPSETAAKPVSQWTRQNPFPGKLVVNHRLSTAESEKDTRHFEIDLTSWGLSFEPGDSVAVYPTIRNWLTKLFTRSARRMMKWSSRPKRKSRFVKLFCAITRSRNRLRSF